MPSLCWFYGMRPKDFWDLTIEETYDLQVFMQKYLKAQAGK